MGHLLENCLRCAMRTVLDAECIAESSGSEVCRIFRSLQKVKATLAVPDDEAMSKLSASWTKFCALTDLLEYSLSEISEMLSKGKFSSFTGAEMVGLIRALFEDSPKRQAVLSSILERAA